ncbi:hypothetical protein G8A07_18600 [Roseateles sp. DAIF2]|uniref:hypothetical protein n=1 Tax=Roseateles sp. DAIF2 TaxID=2714952 RepID=UPI0018A318BE|nr:hypothetical protein [Roseateles sp. DAIF2]QPF74730.1 hypothetical protein G8A07_18600 [Roseateles sp. DAIF2]
MSTEQILVDPDLEQLAAIFTADAKKDPVGALQRWSASLAHLAAPMTEAAHRLADARLDWSGRAALNGTLDGTALLHRWVADQHRRPLLPRLPFLSQRAAYQYCTSLVRQRGSSAASRALLQGRLLVLGLRHDTSTLINKGRGAYDDHIVVLNGWRRRGSVCVFAGNTEPSAQYAHRALLKAGKPLDERYKGVAFRGADNIAGVDVNADALRDAGRLRAGTYFFNEKPLGFLGARAFRSTEDQTVERDTNGDGRFLLDDPSRIDAKGVGRTMYIHWGGADNAPVVNTWSAGCQTIPKNLYGSFLSAVGHNPSFFYVLIDGQ